MLLVLDDNDDENERGTVRVIPSARLDPCPCVCDAGGCADINEVEAEVEVAEAVVAVADDVDLPCRASESVTSTADPVAPFRTSFTAQGSGVGGCGCCE